MGKKDRMNFEKTLLDAPIKRKRTVRDNKFYLVPLQKPLVPTPYLPAKPKTPKLKTPKPRIKPRIPIAKKVKENVKKLIDEISPYYSPEKIEKFKKELKFIPRIMAEKIRKALKNNVENYRFDIISNDPSLQLMESRVITCDNLERLLREKKGLKFNLTLQVKMKKEIDNDEGTGTLYREPYFSSKAKTITNKDQIYDSIMTAEEEILNRIAEWLSEGSQWVIDEITKPYLNIVSYKPLRGNS